MVSNNDDRNLGQQQFKKNSPGTAWFQMMMIGTLPHSKLKKSALALLDFNDDDRNLAAEQF